MVDHESSCPTGKIEAELLRRAGDARQIPRSFRFGMVQADDHQPLVSILRIELIESRGRPQAVGTVGQPETQQDDLSFQGSEGQRTALDPLNPLPFRGRGPDQLAPFARKPLGRRHPHEHHGAERGGCAADEAHEFSCRHARASRAGRTRHGALTCATNGLQPYSNDKSTSQTPCRKPASTGLGTAAAARFSAAAPSQSRDGPSRRPARPDRRSAPRRRSR